VITPAVTESFSFLPLAYNNSPMSKGPAILAQLVDLLPGGVLGMLIFYAPLAAGIAWLMSPLLRRKMSLAEYFAIAAFWAILLAFYVPLFVAEHRVMDREKSFQRGEPTSD
jgi:hypothetical protein